MASARVLVVERNPAEAARLRHLLEGHCAEVRTARSAAQALAFLEAGGFELALIDVERGTPEELELAAGIRAHAHHARVIVRAARGTVASAVMALRLGAVDYLTPPQGDEALFAALRSALARGTDDATRHVGVIGEIATSLSPDDLVPSLQKALAILVRVSRAHAGEIFLCDPFGRDALLAAWHGGGDVLSERVRFPVGAGYPGIIVEARRALFNGGHLHEDPRFLRRGVVASGLRTFVGVPLRDATSALGSVHLLSSDGAFPLEEAGRLLDAAAQPIATAVRAGLAALRQSVDAALTGSHSEEATLRHLIDAMRAKAAAREGALMVLDARGSPQGRHVATSPGSGDCRCFDAVDSSKCPSFSAKREIVMPEGRRHWPRQCRATLPRHWTRPCCVPLAVAGRVHGMVMMDLGGGVGAHGGGQLVPLLAMAQQAASWLVPRLALASAGPPKPLPERTGGELAIRALGPFTLLRRGQPIPVEAFTRSRSLALLRLLALKGGAPVHREVLIEHLWPDVDPDAGLNRLHGVVHDLRSVIERPKTARDWSFVRQRGDCYYLAMDAPIDFDVTDFRALVTRELSAKTASVDEAAALLERALELYRGDLFEDEPFADWCSNERDELRELHRRALLHLATLRAREGRQEEALACLRCAARAHSPSDDLIAKQMMLLGELGRKVEALSTYDAYVRTLADELGVGPSDEIRLARQRVLRGKDRER